MKSSVIATEHAFKMEEGSSFSIPDYVVFALVLLSSSAIGIYYALRGGRQKSSGEFLMADRSMGFFPVAMSLIASLFTGIHIQGVTSEMYFRGTMFWWNVVPQAVTCWIAGRCFLPIYFKLQITSVYEVRSRGGHLNVKRGYQARPKINVKRVFFHNRALYVRNVNRVLNSCKIDLEGYDFLEILRI